MSSFLLLTLHKYVLSYIMHRNGLNNQSPPTCAIHKDIYINKTFQFRELTQEKGTFPLGLNE